MNWLNMENKASSFNYCLGLYGICFNEKAKKRWQTIHRYAIHYCLLNTSLRRNKSVEWKWTADLGFRTDTIFSLILWFEVRDSSKCRENRSSLFSSLKKCNQTRAEAQLISSFLQCLEGRVRCLITEHTELFQGNKYHLQKWPAKSGGRFCLLVCLFFSMFLIS